MAVDEGPRNYEHPAYDYMERMPGLSLAMTTVDKVLEWSATNSLWIFPMATSCCAIEFMTSAASRVDIDQIGSVVRPTPRHCDVMIVAGTITVKMAPRVKKLWEQMPEPKWCIAMGSCAISGDFYRDIYSVVPGIDTVVPVDVYIPGCPPNADQVLAGLIRLQERIRAMMNFMVTMETTRLTTLLGETATSKAAREMTFLREEVQQIDYMAKLGTTRSMEMMGPTTYLAVTETTRWMVVWVMMNCMVAPATI